MAVKKTSRPRAAQTRTFDAFPDKIDLRDWAYQPTLAPLPDAIVNNKRVPEILDQGMEGACTGFALAAVTNYLLHNRGAKRRVSPRMLYEMARCYDEWPGENYEGSSARGAMKGWARHGVCARARWPDGAHGRARLTAAISREALATPSGAYYRVKHREIRDMHAALSEVGILYATMMVHDGWDAPGPVKVSVATDAGIFRLPVIQRRGRAASGHAVAIVGYSKEGFIIQNSWGTGWGARGFALLPYEDYLLHATDVWVAQLGVPLEIDLWNPAGKAATDSTSGMYRAGRNIPLSEIRPYVIDIGNNGELSQSGEYWTTEEDLHRLFAETIPAATREWDKKRIMLYLHGGLNSERDAAKRTIAFRDVCLANNIYPLCVMWETGPLETLGGVLGDMFTKADERAGGGFMEGMREAKDRMIEITAAPIGGPMWSEMKENSWRASDHRQGKGGMQLIARYALEVLGKASKASREGWELHVVAHSAGSILTAHAMPHLTNLGIALKTVQFFAPAIRADEFKEHMLPYVQDGRCPRPTLYVLNEEQERSKDKSMGPYGKSLLWLVSNGFEDRRGTPILGMKHFIDGDTPLAKLLNQPIDGLPGLVVSTVTGAAGASTASTTHGGFDNDPHSMNSVLHRILGRAPARPFAARDLQFE
ncbi:MAG: hypothetical protein A2V90_08940 [Gammaproteobacteria bacterium RBG_16_57_12]|nr:MAG: hypothetical protein A2V90_08940 [Gammaproteobacteria bacterium RBG_16_57_12]